ncbi:MAG TPA: NADH-quinone oxidoreductase subunit J [Chromatiaceae bacterium]|nr:NADH-quinone oxidoreductase subunit J [Chromatiaceae bacterium]HIP70036.1 NADH-quinone oxidoreductase subunit J [Anaerolineae bacterium]
MTSEQVVFILAGILTIGAALVVVTNRNLFHAALALMASFLGVAGIYITLDAGFLAAAQLLVYIGAISILIIFAIMVTRRMMQVSETPFNSQRGLGLFVAVASFLIVAYVILRSQWFGAERFSEKPPVEPAVLSNTVVMLGASFVNPDAFALPFIVISVLLLAALIGAIYIAWPRQRIGTAEDEA